jgi:hypothetical protein
MPGSHPIDGSLAGWNDIAAGEWSWEGALIGNGLSINVWPNFNYASLYDEAERGTKYGGLSDEDKALFAEFDTHNFEIALARLNSTIRITERLGQDPRSTTSGIAVSRLLLGRLSGRFT